jgi:hypothetical protein
MPLKKPKTSTPSGKGAQPCTRPALVAALMSAYFWPVVTFLGAVLVPPMVARVTTTFMAAMQDMVEGGGGGVEGGG